MIDLGIVKPGSTIYIPFASYAGSTGAPSAMTGLATSDILAYKDGSVTERASASGYTLLDTDGLDFDGKTGINGISIDLSDNTTADFWQAGSRYWIVIGDVTVDSQTVRFVAATFTIGLPSAVLNTFIATLASQTSFTLNAGPAEDNALKGCRVYIHDAASAVQGAFGVITAYTGSTKTVTLAAGATFTVAAKDNIMVLPPIDVYSVGGTAQTAGDIYARLGAPAGASMSVDIAAIKTDTGNLTSRITSTLFSGITQLSHWLGAIAGKQAANATAQTEIRASGAGSGTFDPTTDSIEAIRDRGDAAWTTAAGFSTLDAAGVRSAVGLASANLDTQLTAIDDYLDTEVAAIKAKTDQLTFTVANQIDANILSVDGVADAADRLQRVVQGNVFGTVGVGSTTTSIITSALDPAAAVNDQYKGRILTFKNDTTTANLRGQSTDITASTSLGVLTVTALTTSPANGDTFTIS